MKLICTAHEYKTTTDTSLALTGRYAVPDLPLARHVESKAVLRKTREAARALAELKGFAKTMPNQSILINTLALQEAKDSSAIENIITTHDELFASDSSAGLFASAAAKEVHSYSDALKNGYAAVRDTGLITCNLIQEIQRALEGNNAGFRTQAGTALKNEQTGEIIYTPPQSHTDILRHMKNLEAYINDNGLCDYDPLVKTAIIHHQFESIHPFFDGNGRTGRILNILYLVQQGLLDTPILYLSRYINRYKSEYYRLLQQVRDTGEWEEWILFILEGVYITSVHTIELIKAVKDLMQRFKQRIRNDFPKIYSQDLLNNLFRHPYTKIAFLSEDLRVHRNTAASHLNELADAGLLEKQKHRREAYFLNTELITIFLEVGAAPLIPSEK